MIHYRNTVRQSGVDARRVKRTAKLLLEAVGEPASALSISFVADGEIQALNRIHRGKDKPTDVSSFPLAPSTGSGQVASTNSAQAASTHSAEAHIPERLLGDIVINVDAARRQASDYDASLEAEVNRLLIHGVLHVMGHDHEEAADGKRMRSEERRLATVIGMRWPYED